MPYMVLHYQCTEARIVNGFVCRYVGVAPHEDDLHLFEADDNVDDGEKLIELTRSPYYIVVRDVKKRTKCKGKAWRKATGLYNYEIPIFPIESDAFNIKAKKDAFIRSQIPLNASPAQTAHKSQGLTLDKVLLYPRRCQTVRFGWFYTAITRVKALNDILFLGPIDRTMPCKPPPPDMLAFLKAIHDRALRLHPEIIGS